MNYRSNTIPIGIFLEKLAKKKKKPTQLWKTSKYMKTQGKMTPVKACDNFPVTDPIEMESTKYQTKKINYSREA